MWFDCVERKRRAKLPASATAPRTFAAVPSFQAWMRAFICTFCMCVCVYAYLCIDCGSQYQWFSVWTVSCMRMCFRAHMYAYTYVCGYIYMCIFLQ